LPEIAQSERERIIGVLGPSPVDIDEVARATGIAVRKVHIVLLELDLAGKLQRHGRQLVSLIGEDQPSVVPRALDLRLFFCHGEQIGNHWKSRSLGDRLELVDEGGDVIRGLAPRQIGSVDGAFLIGRVPGPGRSILLFLTPVRQTRSPLVITSIGCVK
jgi:hypothetical protein